MDRFEDLSTNLDTAIVSLMRSLGGPSAALDFIKSGAKKETLRTQDQKDSFQHAVNAAKELCLEPAADEQAFVPLIIAVLFEHATK